MAAHDWFGSRSPRPRRRGLSSIWLLIALPTLMVLFCLIVSLGNLWLARVELENAMESAALAAVLEWGQNDGATTVGPREAGVAYAAANRVRGIPVVIDTNLDPAPTMANPNANLTCVLGPSPPTGNLIFGAIVNDDPLTFNALTEPSCSRANVLIEVCKSGAATSTVPDMIGAFYRDGEPGVSIIRIEVELPIPLNNQGDPKPFGQWPYWEGSFATNGRKPVVSISDTADDKNLNNADPAQIIPPINGTTQTYDARGLNPAPTFPNAGQPQDSDWSCNSMPIDLERPCAGNPNGSGIYFTFANLVPGEVGKYRTLEINFNPGEFLPPTDPNDASTWRFIRYGASLNAFGPPGFQGSLAANNNNDGDMFGLAGAVARVYFSDNTSCQATFVDTADELGEADDDRSEAVCGGSSGQNQFAVRAQAIVRVPLSCGPFFQTFADAYCVKAKATAVYDCATRRAYLVRIKNDNFICP